MKKKYIILVCAMALFGSGWAVRSTFLFPNYINKPFGGIAMAIGGIVAAICIIVIFQKPKQ